VRTLGVAGGSGSGKSTLVHAIVEHLGEDRCAVLRQDHYYHDLSHLPLPERAAVNFDHPKAIDLARLAADLDRLRAGEPARRPVYDFRSHTRERRTVAVEPRPVVIVEGTLIGWNERILAGLDGLVYVELEEEERFARRRRRDARERGRTEESVRRQWERTVAPMHRAFVAQTRHRADLVVRGDEPPADLAAAVALRLLH
jgi:uridine kinase